MSTIRDRQGKRGHAAAILPDVAARLSSATADHIKMRDVHRFAPAGDWHTPLQRLAGLARELAMLADELTAAPSHASAHHRQPPLRPAASGSERWLDLARRAYQDRRSRAALFGDDGLFGEPAWDLLLDLFIAAAEGKRVPVTSACIGAAVPTTTALRWLAVLEEQDLVRREADASDARRIFVHLSPSAHALMVDYFARSAGLNGEEPAFILRG